MLYQPTKQLRNQKMSYFKKIALIVCMVWSLGCLMQCTSTPEQTVKNKNPEPPASSRRVVAPDTSQYKLNHLEGSEYIWGKKPCTGVNRSTFRAVLVFLPQQVVRYVYTNVTVGDEGKGYEEQKVWKGTYQRQGSELTLHFTQITQWQKGFDDVNARQTQQEKIDKKLAFKAVMCHQKRSALQNLSTALDPEKGGNWVKK
ncbi:lipoprotein, putative [Microscilla marina ATCC 23134]|uniref:Lipoprotein, putative n=2 Tax=Microscilla marina TaxID=1027 RepID=A1ZNF3_MICM2|nr:lipoprotein, putative [Microscilla marina ATCC 23134]